VLLTVCCAFVHSHRLRCDDFEITLRSHCDDIAMTLRYTTEDRSGGTLCGFEHLAGLIDEQRSHLWPCL